MPYKYQMHAHTYPCSGCGKQSMEELIESLRAGGYQGCVITNHFLHGRTGIDKSLPWQEFVKAYELDWLQGKAYGEQYGLDILFSIEEGLGGGLEILCYGITPQVLYDHPELAERNLEVWHKVLQENGALTIQAHPFRTGRYIPNPGLVPEDQIDGIEIFNYGNSEEENTLAAEAAAKHPQWILTAGADSHSGKTACCSGVECDKRITNEQELVTLLRSRAYRLLTE